MPSSNTFTAAQTTEAQPGSARPARAAATKAAGSATGPSSTGSGSRSMPTASTVCRICAARVGELVMIRTRGPGGSGCRVAILATSSIALRRCTTITPACRNRASTASSGAWPSPPRTPEWDARLVRPGANTTTGLRRVSRRVIRENLRGLPMESSDSRQTRVAGSSSQYCITSFAVTSA